MNAEYAQFVFVHLLGQARIVLQAGTHQQALPIQPKPLHMLAYLVMHGDSPCRREELQALFWPERSPRSAANNLRQALWHLRQNLPLQALIVQDGTVQWNPDMPTWIDTVAFETALDAGDLDAALKGYVGPLLPDVYDEWAQLERERLHLRYLSALEARAHSYYEAHRWQDALASAEALRSADPMNESALRLVMACHWALGQREVARRCYDAYRQRVRRELDAVPLHETTDLYRSILRGENHPDRAAPFVDQEIAARASHFSLLEVLGAFRQGVEQATAWADQADGLALAAALHWQGRFYLRLGRLPEAQGVLVRALALASTPDLKATVLAELATVETGQGGYAAAEQYYAQAASLAIAKASPLYLRLLSSLGGLQGRLGHTAQARRTLEEAVRLARACGDPAPLAVASGNLGILLIGLGDKESAQAAFREALDAARRADAHWLTAYLTGHLGVLAQDRCDLHEAAKCYQRACDLAELIGDQRSAVLWTMNLGSVRYERAQYTQAIELLTQGRELAAAQESQSLVAGADLLIGSCLVALHEHDKGMARIDQGRALAQEIGDQQRILMGYLHKGRALVKIEQLEQARSMLQEGLSKAQASQMHRMAGYLGAELDKLTTA